MKRVYKYLIILISLFIPIIVKADRIYNINMDVNIEKNGEVYIEEEWDVKADSGTEWYKGYKNMRSMDLLSFEVYMDDKLLKEESNWDLDASLNDKAGYYGVHYTDSGFELCFGKKDFKRHTFTLKYRLSNMIFNVDDAQVLYFTFLPSITCDNYSIVIDSYYEFPDDLAVWGYGAKGYAYVEDGKIKMSNEGSLNNDYVTLLAKFPLNTFEISNRYDLFNTFDEVLDAAEEGTFDYDYDYDEDSSGGGSVFSFIFNVLGNIILEVVFFLLPFGLFYGIYRSTKNGYKDNKKIDKKNTPMFREIPCNKDIYYANALIKLNNFNYKESNILGAILLKWVKEDRIKFINGEDGAFNKNTSKIDMTKGFVPGEECNPNEMNLYAAMYEASEDGYLEAKELEKWAKKNYSKFFSILNGFATKEIEKLKSEGHIYKRTFKAECKYKNVMDDVIYKDSSELYGLKLFLQEFSEIDKKEVIEVKLWDEYLMFAYLFGIADKVAKQFKNLYPEIMEDMQNRNMNIDYNTLIFINSISTSSVVAASSARSAATSYSSGGGGFSSGGGGGGSCGGGGSAGGR